MLTWNCAVFVLSTPARDRLAFASVPAPLLTNFASQLEAGVLDETIGSYLALSPRGRRLGRATATTRPGLYDQLARASTATRAERAARGSRSDTRRFATKRLEAVSDGPQDSEPA